MRGEVGEGEYGGEGESREETGEEETEWEEEDWLGQKDSSLVSSWVTDSIDFDGRPKQLSTGVKAHPLTLDCSVE